MASPNPIPPPPIPPYRPQRSISGPLILITVGLIFLLATMHVLSLHNVWLWFGHYWPVLLWLIPLGAACVVLDRAGSVCLWIGALARVPASAGIEPSCLRNSPDCTRVTRLR